MFDHKNFVQAEMENRQREDHFEQEDRSALKNVLREGLEAFRQNKRRKRPTQDQ